MNYIHTTISIIWCFLLGVKVYQRFKSIPNADRRCNEIGLGRSEKLCLLLLPLVITITCVVWEFIFVTEKNSPVPLWFFALGIILFISLPLCKSQARWFGIPLALREMGHQLVYGVIISFSFVLIITYIVQWIEN